MTIGAQRGNFFVSTISNVTSIPDSNYCRWYVVAGKSDTTLAKDFWWYNNVQSSTSVVRYTQPVAG